MLSPGADKVIVDNVSIFSDALGVKTTLLAVESDVNSIKNSWPFVLAQDGKLIILAAVALYSTTLCVPKIVYGVVEMGFETGITKFCCKFNTP